MPIHKHGHVSIGQKITTEKINLLQVYLRKRPGSNLTHVASRCLRKKFSELVGSTSVRQALQEFTERKQRQKRGAMSRTAV